MKKYIDYAETQDIYLISWINTTAKNHIKKYGENQGELEHIIDFFKSDAAPKRIQKMSYPEACESSKKWVEALKKQGKNIEETEDDTSLILDFNDGFKVVQLVGERAYKREGLLMSHCVASYAAKDVKIYSLRDAKNNPHATIEWGNQIKGKGNGSVNPKYIDYIVKFMKFMQMPMRASEMEQIGYVELTCEERDFVLLKKRNIRLY